MKTVARIVMTVVAKNINNPAKENISSNCLVQWLSSLEMESEI